MITPHHRVRVMPINMMATTDSKDGSYGYENHRTVASNMSWRQRYDFNQVYNLEKSFE